MYTEPQPVQDFSSIMDVDSFAHFNVIIWCNIFGKKASDKIVIPEKASIMSP